MEITLKIRTELSQVKIDTSPTSERSTVRDLLDLLEVNLPGIKARFIDESGQLRQSLPITIYVNSEDFRFVDGLDTVIADGDEVSLIPTIAGGSGGFIEDNRKNRSNPDPYRRREDETVRVSIIDLYIDPAAEEDLDEAIDRYMGILGYLREEVLNIERGSLFKDIRYRIATFLTPEVKDKLYEESEKFYSRGKANIEAQLEKPGVESTKQIVEATANLLKAVENFDNTALRLGKLIVVKITDENGKSQVFVETISTSLQNELEANPRILRNPQAVADFLQIGEKSSPSLITDGKNNFS